ncbi:M48 family metallopeptidase [Thiohalomonas denitrificans]|uniref:M48 family metallopeptidase n=1 Tax=Thiohalomonas denitrificans TaxID=415747 RepID=UPI0026EC8AD8|nr:SprT family zinc-dependent metalloprotease [Thiohalomonas denitrificans]
MMSEASSPGWRGDFRVRPSSRAKHVRLKVVPPGRVEVVVPRGFDQRQLPELLARHEEWLVRTVEKVSSEYGGTQAEIVPPDSVELSALGRRHRVEYRRHGGTNRCVLLRDGTLRVHHGEESDWRDALRRWLAYQGREHLPPWLDRVSEEVGLPYRQVTIRSQKTRWGSCSARKNISLNCGLLFFSPRLVRYLFIHELCHTVHMNHSRRFWGLVEQLEPDYRQLDQQLKLTARNLPAWVRRD